MAKGRDTMVNENTREEITAGDGLQLGHTSVDQSEIQTAEEEVTQLEEKVAQVCHAVDAQCKHTPELVSGPPDPHTYMYIVNASLCWSGDP